MSKMESDNPILTKDDPRAGKFPSEVTAELEGKIKPLTVELASVEAKPIEVDGAKARIVFCSGEWPVEMLGSPIPHAGGFVVVLPVDFKIPKELEANVAAELPEGAQPLEVRESGPDGTEICHRIF